MADSYRDLVVLFVKEHPKVLFTPGMVKKYIFEKHRKLPSMATIQKWVGLLCPKFNRGMWIAEINPRRPRMGQTYPF